MLHQSRIQRKKKTFRRVSRDSDSHPKRKKLEKKKKKKREEILGSSKRLLRPLKASPSIGNRLPWKNRRWIEDVRWFEGGRAFNFKLATKRLEFDAHFAAYHRHEIPAAPYPRQKCPPTSISIIAVSLLDAGRKARER